MGRGRRTMCLSRFQESYLCTANCPWNYANRTNAENRGKEIINIFFLQTSHLRTIGSLAHPLLSVNSVNGEVTNSGAILVKRGGFVGRSKSGVGPFFLLRLLRRWLVSILDNYIKFQCHGIWQNSRVTWATYNYRLSIALSPRLLVEIREKSKHNWEHKERDDNEYDKNVLFGQRVMPQRKMSKNRC